MWVCVRVCSHYKRRSSIKTKVVEHETTTAIYICSKCIVLFFIGVGNCGRRWRKRWWRWWGYATMLQQSMNIWKNIFQQQLIHTRRHTDTNARKSHPCACIVSNPTFNNVTKSSDGDVCMNECEWTKSIKMEIQMIGSYKIGSFRNLPRAFINFQFSQILNENITRPICEYGANVNISFGKGEC